MDKSEPFPNPETHEVYGWNDSYGDRPPTRVLISLYEDDYCFPKKMLDMRSIYFFVERSNDA